MNYDRKEYETGLMAEALKPLPTIHVDNSQVQILGTVPVSGPLTPDPLNVQVDGNHYKDLHIQPVEYIHANGIGYFEGNVIKYVTRWRAKGGVKDLEKAKHYIELLIGLETK